MTITAVFLCGGRRGRSAGGKHLIARCDHDGCNAELFLGTHAEYVAAAEAGWRRQGNRCRCPDHAAADGWR